MTKAVFDSLGIAEDVPLVLNCTFSHDDFFNFCRLNDELRIERDANGTIHIRTPKGFSEGVFNSELSADVGIWNRAERKGKMGSSNTGYTLPNGATRSPDVSWISNERFANISKEALKKFAPLCPDFVIEIRSPSDALPKLKAKMVEYMENGCRLGWLIDKASKQVFIYRKDGSITVVKSFSRYRSSHWQEALCPGGQILQA